MMYRLFMPFWKDLATMARVEQYAAYARLRPRDDPVVESCPPDYVAARFYFSECFPDTSANRAFVASTIDAISRHTPVVLLNTPFAGRRPSRRRCPGGRVLPSAAQMPPERNLAVQTRRHRARPRVRRHLRRVLVPGALLRRQLAGVLFGSRTFKVQHLHVAQHVFARLGGATVVPLDVAALPPVAALTLGGLRGEPS